MSDDFGFKERSHTRRSPTRDNLSPLPTLLGFGQDLSVSATAGILPRGLTLEVEIVML